MPSIVTKKQNGQSVEMTKAPGKEAFTEVSSGFEPLYAVLQTAA